MRPLKVHKRLKLGLQAVLIVGAGLAAWEQQWMAAVTTTAIVLLTFFPLVMERRFGVIIPPELELLATIFIFASLFLGEVRGYYLQFWWWDIALHTAAGFLVGIVGFLLVYILNARDSIHLHMSHGFVALFAFAFAVGIGGLWEIFEFAMDRLFGMNMQKPMLGDPSGLTDTMWDLIVNAVGAAAISLLGYGYLRAAGSRSFLERWILDFIRANPGLFRRRRRGAGSRVTRTVRKS